MVNNLEKIFLDNKAGKKEEELLGSIKAEIKFTRVHCCARSQF